MKKRPSRAFTISIVFLFGIGGLSAWSIQRVCALSSQERAGRSFFAALQYSFERSEKSVPVDLPTEEQRMHTLAETDRVMAQLQAEFPALAITEHPVPAEENGFLQLYLLGKSSFQENKHKRVTEIMLFRNDFSSLLADRGKWDGSLARKYLAEEAEAVARVERIAALKSRSTANMPTAYDGFFQAYAPKQAAEMLLVKACLAAEEKDQVRAMQYVEAAANIGQHMHAVDRPYLLPETVRILIDLKIQEVALKQLLPALGKDADLAGWKALLSRPDYTPADFAIMMRGEWQTTSRYFLLPHVLDERKPDYPKDADKLARIHASIFNDFVVRLPKLTLRELMADPGIDQLSPDTPNLSKKSRSILDELRIGSRAWAKGYVRAASTISRNQAALDLLILEKNGTTLEASTTQKVVLDPLTGEPFLFDPAKRTVNLPSSSPLPDRNTKIEPITLPW